MERNVNWSKIILAFLIATLLFSSGLFSGFLIKMIMQNSIISVEESVRNEIVNIETLSLMEENYPCESTILNIVSDKLDYLGRVINDLEDLKGKTNKDVLEMKKLYSLLEVRHVLLVQERGLKCNEDYNIFLFFYSNDKSKCVLDVEKTSFILNYLRNKYDNTRVYSFDVDLNSDIVHVLKNRYEIDSCRAVVLNDQKLNISLESSGELEVLLLKA